MKRLTLSVMAIAMATLSLPVAAQDAAAVSGENPPDIDTYINSIDLRSLATTEEVAELKSRTADLLTAQDCVAGIPALLTYADRTNQLANMIAQGAEPFYRASRSASDGVHRTIIMELAAAEDAANEYKNERNKAWVALADCYLQQGDNVQAVGHLHRALRYIPVTETELWKEARQKLWKIVGYEPPAN